MKVMNDHARYFTVIEFVSLDDQLDHVIKLELPVFPFWLCLKKVFSPLEFGMRSYVVLNDSKHVTVLVYAVFGKFSVFLDKLSREPFEVLSIGNTCFNKLLLVVGKANILVFLCSFPFPYATGY